MQGPKSDIVNPEKVRTWNVWINCGEVDLTFHYLINEYRMLMGAYDPTFKFAGAQAKAKAQLLRDAILHGAVVLDEYF